jgi:RNA 2',3'-cyclic 3'-phosphodiesterase
MSPNGRPAPHQGRPGAQRPGGRSGPPRTGGFARPEDDPPGTSRLFIAVPVADDVRAAIGEVMSRVAGAPIEDRAYGQPRWVRVDGLHVTLRFLGPTPDARQQEVGAVVAEATRGVAPFRVALSGAGAFPNPYRPRVLWIGITEGAGELGAIAARLNDALAKLGWTPDDRPFAPHLTLARTDGVPGADVHASKLQAEAAGVSLAWTADRVVLYKSVLGRGAARYEAIAEAPLGRD